MSESWRIERPKLVIVEGREEVSVLTALLSRNPQLGDIQVQDYQGYGKLREFLRALRGVSGYELLQSLAVVADADRNRTSRDQSIRTHLGNVGFPVPARPLTVEGNSEIRVAYLVVPHGINGRMLEDVCLESVSDHPVMDCVKEYYDCILNKGVQGPREVWMSKARVHTFLAAMDDPTLRLGEAAEKGIWPFEHSAFDPMKELLRII